MRTNIMRLFASLLLIVFMAPQAFAQETDEQEHEVKEAFENHYHLGTMTPPNQGTMDIKYMMSMADGEHMAWIVIDAGGEEVKIPMMDLAMAEGVVTYNWASPDSDEIISCELESVEDGGWAGDCISDDDDGDIGQMTMGPMMNHDADHKDGDDHEDDHGYDKGDHAKHDADDDGDSVPTEDSEADG
ncbi:MAG: hypothetical protein V3S56_08305 [Gemmatimonadota bacterium]